MSVFSQTQNLVEFMNAKGYKGAELLNNESTGANFISFDKGTLVARVGKDITALSADLSISYFTPEEGEASWMVHRKGESSATVLSTFSLEADLTKV